MKWNRAFSLILSLTVVLGLLPLLATAAPSTNAQADKIEQALLDKFAAEGTADFIVHFAEQADLSPAYQMDWNTRGEFVYNTLKETAERSQAHAKALLEANGLKYQTFIAGNELYVWAGNQAAANALAALPEVYFIRTTRTYYVDPIIETAPSTPDSPNAVAWGILDVKADQFWSAFGVQGDGIVVANIDTGVQWDHPALDQAFKCGANPSDPACWSDPSNICGGSMCDNNGHGTHTMGTMVADDDPSLTWQAGMAPNAQWIACKGCESSSCSEYALNTCADWIVAPNGNPANRPHIVNNSWGGGGCDNWYLGKVNAWRAAGIFPAFSAGNNTGCSSLGSPGDYQESFGTTGHDTNRNHYFAQGPSCFGHDPYTKPNITAPAVNVCSTVPTNSWSCGYSGTSMASPHTAGAVALLWSCNPSLIGQMDLTFQALQNNADPPTPANPGCGAPPDGEGTYEDGYGYLNVLQAGLAVCGGVDTGWLDGHVYDATTNNPIAGATVTASPATEGNSIQATTDPNGYYTMTLVVGTYNVTASKTGYAPQTVTGVEVLTNTVTTQDFYLTYQGQWMPGTQPTCFDLTRIDAEYYPGTGKVYILGGRSGSNTVGTIYEFDPEANTCAATGATMPVPISNYTVNLVNDGTYDLLCTFGGRDSAGAQTLAVQCYNPVLNTASQVATLPSAYTGYMPGAQVVVNNRVYIFGGFNPNASPYELMRTDRFNPLDNSFTQLGNLSMGRGYIMATAVDGKIYAFGGTVYDGASLVAQTRTEVMADPEGAGTWDNAAVAELPQAGAEGRAFGFDTGSLYGLGGKIILAPAYAQWPGESNQVIAYDVASNSYDETFPDLITARRNNADAFVPICTPDPADGLPGMWVIGGRAGSDNPPYAGPEYYPLSCAVAEPELAFTKTVDVAEAYGGQHVTYTLTYSNTGDADAPGAVITDNLPAEVAYVSSDPAGTYYSNTHQVIWTVDIYSGTTDSISLVVEVSSQVTAGTVADNYAVLQWQDLSYEDGASFLIICPPDLPTAAFTFTPTVIYTDTAVQFTDTSTGPVVEWYWEFSDGYTYNISNPVHTFLTTGTFTVTLTVTSDIGCVDTAFDTVEVVAKQPPPPPQHYFVYLPIVVKDQ